MIAGILPMGMILREREGPFRIGAVSVPLLIVHAGAIALSVTTL
jgi:cation:H+ antiporter